MRLKQRTVSQDVNYIVRNGEVVIVDEFTGRVPGRRWSDGLHQAIEAKERVEIQPETQNFGITYQNLFLLYPKLAGMTGLQDGRSGVREDLYGSDDHSTNRPPVMIYPIWSLKPRGKMAQLQKSALKCMKWVDRY